MKPIAALFMLTACLSAAGCAGTGASKPAAAKTATLQLSKDTVWMKLTTYFSSHNLPMRKMQKGEGIIYAGAAVAVKDMTAQQKRDFQANAICGVKFATPGGYVTGVTVFVQGTPTKTSLLVKAAFEEVRTVTVGGNFTPSDVIAKCASSGRLENEILAAVGS